MTEEKVIQVNNAVFCYETEDEESRSILALNGVSFSVERGSFVAILGPNGSGKSTVAKHLNALLVPSSGDVIVYGKNTMTVDPIEIRSRVGMVFQNPDNQLVSAIVEDDVAFGPENLGVESSQIRERVDESLKKVSMYQYRKKGPHLLSGGQKQRVAIAGVMAMNTDCIVFDEPTAMLDPSGRKEIMDIIQKLHEEKKTVVLITHFMEEAVLADRVIVMDDGKVIMEGAPKEIFRSENAEKLSEAKLALPFATQLANKLREKGMNIPENIINEEELADYLCALK